MEETGMTATESILWPENYTDTTMMTDVNSTPTRMPTMMTNYTATIEPQVSTAVWALYYGIKFLFVSFAMFGNTLTIVAVAKFERLQNNTSVLICSLAVADMLGCLQAPVDFAHELTIGEPVFVPLCLIHFGTVTISIYMNYCSILGIAVDRYILIAHPLHYPSLVTSTKTYVIVGITWAVIVTEISSIFIFTNDMVVGKTCKPNEFLPGIVPTVLAIQLLVTIVLTIGFYVAIGRIAHKQGVAIAELNYSTYEATLNRSHKKIAKMMATVLGMTLLCFTQLILGALYKPSTPTMFSVHYEKATALLYWLNVWLNPVIYAWKSEDFRTAFRKLLRLRPASSPYQSNNPS